MQRLLNSYDWDAGAVRDALARYVVASAGHPAAVLVADETGFLKKGRRSAGVQRQYTGTAGRVENCQVGVFLAYATPDGSRALIDRELYVPAGWIADPDRCAQAGVPGDAQFATKPALARQMVERALEAEVPFGWFAGDEVYGQNPGLRDRLEEQHIRYVMAVPCSEPVTTKAGKVRADQLAGRVPHAGWPARPAVRPRPLNVTTTATRTADIDPVSALPFRGGDGGGPEPARVSRRRKLGCGPTGRPRKVRV